MNYFEPVKQIELPFKTRPTTIYAKYKTKDLTEHLWDKITQPYDFFIVSGEDSEEEEDRV